MATYIEQSLAALKQFEGSIPWMYRDTVGKVTVGVGLMLPDVAAASRLAFEVDGRAATPEEIAADFHRVGSLPPGHSAGFYRSHESPQLPPAEIDALLGNILAGFEAGVRERMPAYDSFLDGVKMALLDMAYNLGVAGLFHGYPKLIAAVEAGRWADAAADWLRHGIGDARNAWAKAQFLSAAVVGRIQAAAGDPPWKRLLYGLIGLGASLVER